MSHKEPKASLVVEEPDAPGGAFRHWAAYNIPATTTGLPAGFHAAALAPFPQARNDFWQNRL